MSHSRSTVLIVLTALACAAKDDPQATDDGSGTSSGAESSSSSGAPSVLDDTSSSSSSDGPASTSSSESSESSSGGGFVPRPDAGSIDGLPLGESCAADDECDSGHCWQFPGLGFGICSDCSHDSECMVDDGPGTCGLQGSPWAVCTEGEPGAFCESADGCARSEFCVATIEGLPFLQCSECAEDTDCEKGEFCVPGAGKICAPPGSLELGEFCSEGADVACASGHCTSALSEGQPSPLWVCGECSVAEDCLRGEVCTPAELLEQSVEPATCDPAP